MNMNRINRELDDLANLTANWDGEGAWPIDPTIIDAARDLAAQIPDEWLDSAAVVPMRGGAVQFEWIAGERELEIEFESPTRIHYLKWGRTERIQEEDIFDVAADDNPEATRWVRCVELVRWVVGADEQESTMETEADDMNQSTNPRGAKL